MGKADKEHRKRVQARNNQLKGVDRMYQKMYQKISRVFILKNVTILRVQIVIIKNIV